METLLEIQNRAIEAAAKRKLENQPAEPVPPSYLQRKRDQAVARILGSLEERLREAVMKGKPRLIVMRSDDAGALFPPGRDWKMVNELITATYGIVEADSPDERRRKFLAEPIETFMGLLVPVTTFARVLRHCLDEKLKVEVHARWSKGVFLVDHFKIVLPLE